MSKGTTRLVVWSILLLFVVQSVVEDIFGLFVDLHWKNWNGAIVIFLRYLNLFIAMEINTNIADHIIDRFRKYFNRVDMYLDKVNHKLIFVKNKSKVFDEPTM